jgi:hypothetical protein
MKSLSQFNEATEKTALWLTVSSDERSFVFAGVHRFGRIPLSAIMMAGECGHDANLQHIHTAVNTRRFVGLYTAVLQYMHRMLANWWFRVRISCHRSRSHITNDSQSTSSSLVSCPFWSRYPDVTFIWVAIILFIFHVGLPLWREDGSVICSAMTQVQFQVTLLPRVCRPVHLGARPQRGP